MSAEPHPAPVEFTLDGVTVHAAPGTTLWEAARAQGMHLPHLCHMPDDEARGPGLRPDGNCRACVVEVAGERVLAASCCRQVSVGMQVETGSERARKARATVIELLLADAGSTGLHTNASELDGWARMLELRPGRFPRRAPVPGDASHPAIAVNLDACIQCTRCLRACREVQGNDVIGLARRGQHTTIAFDALATLGASSCVACGECVQACPTGALMPARGAGLAAIDRSVDSVCPYCGVGCQLTLHVTSEGGAARIAHVGGRDGPANRGRLCVKGRYGFDYVHHAGRLTTPLVRREGVPKDVADIERVKRGDITLDQIFRKATWDEALDLVAGGLARLRDADPGALAGFGSAKGSNEEAYLFQKLVRQGLRTHNVDHCTRLCHASSVTALLEGLGSGAVSNPVADVAEAGFILLIGANPSVNHPVAATFIKNAVDRGGAVLCIADPRRQPLSRRARWHLAFRPGTDVALLNGLLHVILAEGLADADFVAARVNGFDALRAAVAEATPERMSEICGIEPDTLREVARAYASSKGSMILWGMGISQHVHGTDNARALIALALVSGQIGRPGTGLHPLRGQNNVQGASDAGLIPMMLPDYQRVTQAAVRGVFERLWGMDQPLPVQPGLTVVEVMHAASAGRIKGLFVQGENPAMSDPDLNHARAALAGLELLAVQDIFATETALLADVVLPASAHAEKWGSYTNTDRLIQVGRPALDPPGQARQDLWVLAQLARRLGLAWDVWRDADDGDGHAAREAPVARVYEEMRRAMAPLAGVPWTRLVREEGVMTPAPSEDAPGQAVVFTDRFPTADGRASLVPAAFAAGPEMPDAQHPLVLTTGRVLEHWHTGAMTRHAPMLDALAPQPRLSVHPRDAAARGIVDGAPVELASRHGAVRAVAHVTPEVQPGQVFMAFAYWEAAANRLTGDALDPAAKIPGFKVTAVQLTAAPLSPASTTASRSASGSAASPPA